MMQAHAEDRRAKWRKLGVSLLVGGLAGFAGAWTMMTAIDHGALGELSPSRVAALCVALVYLLMGVAVLVGAAAPGVGSTFLNVEDAEELREQRSTILPSAISCLLLAAGLAALALSGPGAMLDPVVALSVLANTLLVSVWLSLTIVRRSDELMRDLMRDGAATSFYLAFMALGGWAVFAHLGLAAAPAMLDIVTLFYALTLVGCFWVIGRRGMLMR